MALAVVLVVIGGCSSKLPAPSHLPLATAAFLSPNTNATTISGKPIDIYQRIARQASTCWFGPFGSAYHEYMTSADVPPSPSTGPVTIVVHRRLKDKKTPWGPTLMRAVLTGNTTTCLDFQNVGLDQTTLNKMKNGFTRWANGSELCEKLERAEPQWQPVAHAPQPTTQPAKKATARR